MLESRICYEKKFAKMEKEETDEMEMAAKEIKRRETQKET